MSDRNTKESITYRRMIAHDLTAAHALSQAVRWAHRRADWEVMLALGMGFVAEEDGVLAGTALCWKYGAEHAALGMIIVAPDLQGRGIGRALMDLVLEELGPRSIQLTATPAGQPLYEKLGFVSRGSVVNHQGTLRPVPPAPLAAGDRIRPAVPGDLPALASLAAGALGVPRDEVLAHLLEVGAGVLLEKEGQPLGFSMIRPFGLGHMIGPVVAPDAARAQALIGHWTTSHAGGIVRVDVSGDSELGPWVESLGLALAGPSVRMLRGAPPVPDGRLRQYAILNQAMG